MPVRWSVGQILDMAPTGASRASARRLAHPGPWSDLGSTDTLIWGKCQGSGRSPYQVVVELDGPIFRCSCPSRLDPCKHALGLLLQWTAGRGTLGQAGRPPSTSPSTPGGPPWTPPSATREVDPEGAARRAAARQASVEERDALMTSGMAEFRRWLGDLARQGLGNARQQPYRFWDATAARLVDAKLPGLAERVRLAGALVAGGGDWAGPLLSEVGGWYAAIRAWERRADLPEALGADLATFVGITRRRDEVIASGTERGRWVVAGVRQGGDARIRNQRTWLIPAGGAAGPALDTASPARWVLLLDFAVAGAALAVPQVVGSVVEADLGRYPGSPPVRGLFADPPTVVGRADRLGAAGRADGLGAVAGSVAAALDHWAQAVAANPWRDRLPAAVAGARVALGGGEAWMVDQAGDGLPLGPGAPLWKLLAVTGGGPADLFGEIEAGPGKGQRFHPMAVAVGGQLVDLA